MWACTAVLALQALAAAEVHAGAAEAAAVDALFAPWSTGATPGAAVLVVQYGRVLLKKGYGLADLETRAPITAHTPFRLASVTKQFTAMAVMILAERGRLGYDDPVSKYIPELPPWARTITLRHLLNHTAGLPEYDDLWMENGALDHDWPRSARTPRSAFEPTSRDVVKLMAGVQAPLFTPGSKFRYSNTGYVLLAQVVERASGERFARFLQSNVFGPLRMRHSLLCDETRPSASGAATTYSLRDGVYRDVDYTPINAIYGEDNVYSTLDDLERWDRALWKSSLVKPSTLSAAFEPATLADGTRTQYGFGWRRRPLLGLDTVRHSGSWVGVRTAILRVPSERFTVVVLANLAQIEAESMANRIAKIYLRHRMTFPAAIAVDPAALREYAGRYEFAPGAVAELRLVGGELRITPPGQAEVRLMAKARDAFFVEHDQEIGVEFQRGPDGRITGFVTSSGTSARRVE